VNRLLPVAALLLAATLLLTQLLPPDLQIAARYDRTALQSGEWWRLITAHLTHLGWRHALLNAAAAAILILLLGHAFDARQWLLAGALSVAAVDAGLWWLSPEVIWYAGASGALHGVIAAGGFALWRARDWRGIALLLLLTAKLAYEQLTTGSLGFSGGIPVVLDAHLYGAIGGALAPVIGSRFSAAARKTA
jgi:rhomboid family GlyGly-CTERM serine protease